MVWVKMITLIDMDHDKIHDLKLNWTLMHACRSSLIAIEYNQAPNWLSHQDKLDVQTF